MTGFVLARSHLAERLLSPYIVAAQATPILALAPLIVLWFGSGLLSKVLICALICYFPMVVATTVGLRSIDPGLVELGRSLRATRRQLLTTIEVPAALPTILGGLQDRHHARRRGRRRGRVGRRRRAAWACSSTSPAAACSTSR